jgi:hypothetical protein
MKSINLIILLLITTLTFGQKTDRDKELPNIEAWSDDFELVKAKDFVYDNKSGFIFPKRMIYSEVYAGTEWWTSMKKMYKNAYNATDNESKKQNNYLSEELSERFPFTYYLLDKYELVDNWPSVILENINKERYFIDNVLSTTHGGNSYSNYYIYDMKEKKVYPIKATTSMSSLITKLLKMIESK